MEPCEPCRPSSGRQTAWKRHGRFSEDGTWDKIHAGLLADADAAGEVEWAVSVDSTINRAHQHAPTCRGTQGALSNYKNLRQEPPDHGIGRSRGGLSTKIHHPDRVAGDKAYSSRAIRQHLRDRDIVAVIPDPPTSKGIGSGAAGKAADPSATTSRTTRAAMSFMTG